MNRDSEAQPRKVKGQSWQSGTSTLLSFMMAFSIDRTHPLVLKKAGDLRNHFSIATDIHRQMIYMRKLMEQVRHASSFPPPMMSRLRQGQDIGKIGIGLRPLLQLLQIVDIGLPSKPPQQGHGLGTRLFKETGQHRP